MLAELPEIRDVISRYTENHCVGAFAYVARLAPASRTGLRRESSNLRVQCMLSLDAPNTGGVIVDGVVERFRQGRCVVVSESAVRQEWNDADRDQLLLIVQLWHPDLSADEIELLEGLSRISGAAVACASGSNAR
jgi:aspartyl/asparaginyl beta-hydroxylase (cupin superfamily)